MAEAKRICSIPDCTKAELSRGWCGMHYERWRIAGDPGGPTPHADRPCSVEGCSRAAFTRTWCQKHYKHWKATGDTGPAVIECSLLDCKKPVSSNGMCHRHAENKRKYGHAEPVRDWPLIARLADVGWDETDRGCWIWRGALNEHGYGTLALRRRTKGAETQRVHRLMWEMHNGPIPEGLVVRHRCDVPACCNPDHLEVGTHDENMRDMVTRRRSLAYSTGRYDGVCASGRHDVTQPGALKEMGGKTRRYMGCVECDRERKRKHQEKKKAERSAARKKAA